MSVSIPMVSLGRRLLLPLIFVIIVVGAIALLGRKQERRSELAMREGILLIGNGAEPSSLDPHLAAGVIEHKILSALLEGLVGEDPEREDGAAPGVAERWESDSEARVWTFHLRSDARWSDGSPVTAGDFVWSYQRLLEPKLLSDYASMLFVLENGREYNQKVITDFAEVGAKALDEKTLQLRLVGPTPHFPQLLKHFSWFPVHPETILDHGSMTDRYPRWTAAGTFVGNGPFRLKRWDFRKIIVVDRNPYYWDAANVKLNEIHFFPIDNASSENLAFSNGLLHYTNTIPLPSIPAYRKSGDPTFHSDPYLAVYFYRINVTRPPLDNPKVRHALSLALDRRSITEFILQGGQVPTKGLVPDMGDYRSPGNLDFRLEEARALLAEAGYPGGQGMRPLTILINTSESHRTMAEAVQEMWLKHLGLRVSITNQDWNVYQDSQRRLDYDISRAGWTGDYLDPMTFLDMWESDSGNNQTGWKNPRFDELLAQARQTGDATARLALLQQAEGLFLTDMPAIPVYFYTRQYLLDPRVGPWPPRLLDNRDWKNIGFLQP